MQSLMSYLSLKARTHTRREVEAARLARDLAKELAYPSDQELIEAIQRGAITNLPVTTREHERSMVHVFHHKKEKLWHEIMQ